MGLYELLFIDVETNAVGSFRPPTQFPMQVAFIVSDNTGTEIYRKGSTLVAGATKIGKFQKMLTLEQVNREGVSPEDAIEMVLKDLNPAKTMIVAHNLDFDLGILLNHANPEQKKKLRKMSKYDTMKVGAYLCKLPNQNGYSDYKYPALSELAFHFNISTENVQLHNAEEDVEVMRKCFVNMRSSR